MSEDEDEDEIGYFDPESGGVPSTTLKVSRAARLFNTEFDRLKGLYPKKKDQRKAGVDLARDAWKPIDALLDDAPSVEEVARVILANCGADDSVRAKPWESQPETVRSPALRCAAAVLALLRKAPKEAPRG